jgi:hypothetical protein
MTKIQILNFIERYATPNEGARRWARGAIRQGLEPLAVLREFMREVTPAELT